MKGPIRKLFTDEQILAAAELPQGYRTLGVPRQTFSYWIQQLALGGKIKTDAMIRRNMDLRVASPYDDEVIVPYDIDTRRILVIPDLHAPYHNPKALCFLKRVADQLDPTHIICMGDETDNHALSFHDSDPNLDAPGRELELARRFIQKLHHEFPRMQLCHSNHGSLLYRRAKKFGIPLEMIKTYREVLFPHSGGLSWSWHDEIRLILPNGSPIAFRHAARQNILTDAGHDQCSLVSGHHHSRFMIQWAQGFHATYFGMFSGCLIDPTSVAFSYGKIMPFKPILGCATIVEGIPALVPLKT